MKFGHDDVLVTDEAAAQVIVRIIDEADLGNA
jgi:central glycolytic genes regulator